MFYMRIPLFCVLYQWSTVWADFTLTILHTNDIRSHFQEFNKDWNDCSIEESSEGLCYGGWARLETKIAEIRKEVDNVLLLDAGNQFGGTLWFTVYKDEAISYFMNRTRYDAMAIGNHEFDNKPQGLSLFLQDADFPVVSSNIDDSKEPVLKDLYKKSHLFEVGGETIAIIGYTYWNTGEISPAGNTVFLEEEASIRNEVNRVKKHANKIIALGHSGIVVDERIAKTVEGIDVIVGGDEQFFFYTGDPPSNDVPKYDYPFRVTPDHDPNKFVPIVQAYRYGKYLGRFDVTFDDNGDVLSWTGRPILLDKDVAEDDETRQEIHKWAQEIEKYKMQYVGTTHVTLDGESTSCRRGECNLGNLITDAMVQQHLQVPNENRWNDVSIALMNAGNIRHSLPPGEIVASDMNNIFKYDNRIDTLDIQGKYLLQALEKSVSEYESVDHGRFLHFSGLQVVYDLNKPPNKRVFIAAALCTECTEPVYEPIQRKHWYRILTTDFIAEGGDGYDMILKNKKDQETGPLDVIAISAYIEQMSPVYPALDGRLRFYEDGMQCSSAVSILPSCLTTLAVTVSFAYFALILLL